MYKRQGVDRLLAIFHHRIRPFFIIIRRPALQGQVPSRLPGQRSARRGDVYKRQVRGSCLGGLLLRGGGGLFRRQGVGLLGKGRHSQQHQRLSLIHI